MENLQPNDFKYQLIVGTTPYDLPQSPIGWEENLIGFKRSFKTWGVVRGFTVPLKFVGVGAKILRSLYYQYGIEALCRINILELNNSTWQYEQAYIGDLDFLEFKDSETSVEINAMQGGLSKAVKAREGTKYDIDLANGIDIKLPLQGFAEKGDLIFETMADIEYSQTLDYSPAVSVVNNGLVSGIFTIQSTQPRLFIESGNWFLRRNTFVGIFPVRVSGYLSIIVERDTLNPPRNREPNQTNLSVVLVTIDGNVFATLGVLKYNEGVEFGAIGRKYNIPFDVNISISNFRPEVYLSIRENVNNTYLLITEGTINVSYITAGDTVNVKGMYLKDVGQALVNKMGGNTAYQFKSFLLNNTKWKNLAVVTGDSLRALNNAKIKTSFKDFFTAIDVQLMAGYSIINDELTLEDRGNFFTPQVPIYDLGEVKDLVLEPAKDFFYSAIEVGYKDNTYEKDFGIDEYNSQQDWETPIQRVSAKLNLISPYRADLFGIQKIYIENFTNKDKDAKGDSDIWLIDLKETPVGGFYVPKTGLDYDVVNGISNPQLAYNLELSPKKMLLRHSRFLASFLRGLDGAQVTQTSAAKNVLLETIDTTGFRVKENEPIDIETLSENPLFNPIIATFRAMMPENMQKILTNNPYGVLSFTYKGVSYKGFIVKATCDISKNKDKDFELLLTYSDNILNLIR